MRVCKHQCFDSPGVIELVRRWRTILSLACHQLPPLFVEPLSPKKACFRVCIIGAGLPVSLKGFNELLRLFF